MSRPFHKIPFRTALLSGALLLAPLVVTIWAFRALIAFLGGTVSPLFLDLLPESLRELTLLWDIAATVLIILFVALLGYVSHIVLGRLFIDVTGRFLQSIPGIGMVYNTVKQVVDTFGGQSRAMFSKVVLVEFPCKGSWSIGFITSKKPGEAQHRLGRELWTVFVPTTPNPTNGFFVFMEREAIRELEMSVSDGMKLVISGGAIAPEWTKSQPAAAIP